MTRELGKPLAPVLKRCMEAMGVENLTDFAAAIEKPEYLVRNWHKRDNVPWAGVKLVSDKSGRPIEMLLGGAEEAESAGQVDPFLRDEVIGGDLVEQVTAAVLDALAQRNLKLAPGKVGALVRAICELEAASQGASAERSRRIAATTERYLRLVA
jgi:hypothetical protein